MDKMGFVSVSGVDASGSPKENQDHVLVTTQQHTVIMAVCDGAGSKKYGGQGSRFLCKLLGRKLKAANFENGSEFRVAVEETVKHFRCTVARLCRWKESKISISDFATTMALHVRRENNSNVSSYFAHIGDGVIVCLNQQFNHADFLSLPENGEYCNQTYFVTDKEWASHLRTEKVDNNYAAVLIFSDGISPMAMKGTEPFFDFMGPLLKFIKNSRNVDATRSITEMLESKESKKISSDDKTICWFVDV